MCRHRFSMQSSMSARCRSAAQKNPGCLLRSMCIAGWLVNRNCASAVFTYLRVDLALTFATLPRQPRAALLLGWGQQGYARPFEGGREIRARLASRRHDGAGSTSRHPRRRCARPFSSGRSRTCHCAADWLPRLRVLPQVLSFCRTYSQLLCFGTGSTRCTALKPSVLPCPLPSPTHCQPGYLCRTPAFCDAHPCLPFSMQRQC